ncbi:hypothetical protein [Zobellella sp. An-6]|uniref:hypothetical protein n=1 Tax=Zobellella sp. An-6 TaxID=3400218 RepID=UPI0040435100
MVYEYKMVQVPPNISVEKKNHKGNEAAAYLQDIANTMANDGWEFYRIDSVGVSVQPGCFGALTGSRAEQSLYYVISFRRPKG